MDGVQLIDKLTLKAARLHTSITRRAFGEFGKGSLLYFPNHVTNPQHMFVGRNVIFKPGSWIMAVTEWEDRKFNPEIRIGDGSGISFNTQISANSKITIGKNVAIARGCVITDHVHNYRVIDKPIWKAPITRGRPVIIEDDVCTGVNCIIGPGVHIGRHVFIAANSVVVNDLPAYSMASGNPARVVRRYDPDAGKWLKV